MKLCRYCSNKGIYKKRVVKSWHYSPHLSIQYEAVWICNKEKCYDKYTQEKSDDSSITIVSDLPFMGNPY